MQFQITQNASVELQVKCYKAGEKDWRNTKNWGGEIIYENDRINIGGRFICLMDEKPDNGLEYEPNKHGKREYWDKDVYFKVDEKYMVSDAFYLKGIDFQHSDGNTKLEPSNFILDSYQQGFIVEFNVEKNDRIDTRFLKCLYEYFNHTVKKDIDYVFDYKDHEEEDDFKVYIDCEDFPEIGDEIYDINFDDLMFTIEIRNETTNISLQVFFNEEGELTLCDNKLDFNNLSKSFTGMKNVSFFLDDGILYINFDRTNFHNYPEYELCVEIKNGQHVLNEIKKILNEYNDRLQQIISKNNKKIV